MELEEVIRETFHLSPETQVLDTHGPGQLEGWDSLGHVNLIAALESKYKVSIGVDEIMEIATIEDIKKMLEQKGVTGF